MKGRGVLNLIVFIKIVQSANILCVFSTISYSHFLFGEPLLVELSRRGHNITVISQYAKPMPNENYTAIILPPNEDIPKIMKLFTDNAGDKLFVLRSILSLFDMVRGLMWQALDHPDLEKIRRDGNIDLLITEVCMGDVFLGLAAELDCPNVQILSVPPLLDVYERMGNPYSLSYAPNSFLSSSSEPMGFVTRVIHFLTSLFEMGVFSIVINKQISVYKDYFPPPKFPTLDEMKRDVSLIMLNTHFSQGIVRPLVPGIIEVSGMHIKPTSPLPIELAEFMNNSPNGVVLFSLGTNVKSSSLDSHKMEILLNTFGKLKENVLWKFDDDQIKSLPGNVKILKWLPQNDLLAHQNLKIFITHGGLGSIIEAKYHGVPLVLIPVFGDQISNAEQVVLEGWGRSLKFENLTAQDFHEAVHDVLNNSTYKERVHNLSLLYRDRPQTAMETAVYWIEYVLRHKGAPHIKSNARHLNFFQLHSIDVIGFLVAGLIIFIGISYIFVKLLITFFWRMIRNKAKTD